MEGSGRRFKMKHIPVIQGVSRRSCPEKKKVNHGMSLFGRALAMTRPLLKKWHSLNHSAVTRIEKETGV